MLFRSNKIYAEANTITGSIGVFGILPNFTEATKKIGINVEQVSTNDNAAGYSAFKPLDDKYRAFAQEGVEKIYSTFVTHVAEGRKMTFAQVDSIGQGRVWAGSDAIKIGLVDKIGGMDDAIKYAADLVKIKNYRTQNFPEYNKDFKDLLGNLGIPFMKTKESFIREEIGEENYKVMEQIKKVQARKGVQASMPFEINIR